MGKIATGSRPFRSETAMGFTLSQMIEKILLICEENLGDISILFDALRQKI